MRLLLLLPLIALTAPPVAATGHTTTIVVAADGSGDHATVQDAVNAVPAGNTRPVIILVRKGTYRQQVVIPADKPHISLVGDTRDPREVVLTFDASAATQKPDGSGPYGTSGSASYTISAPDFTPEKYLAGGDGWSPVRRHRPIPREPGREVLPRDDGWASATTGTTGGSAARPEDVHVVRTRAELVAALGNPAGNTPRSSM
ncbi:pectinesterase family protein [Nonomuraea sp. B19D2]|uniref:pectinesterase family protein n=1 Tax=Nonomuraea sp. B19D2 TaxID=3159561 RepID=UPI0032DB6C31